MHAVNKTISNKMQETDILGEHLFNSNKTEESCIYFSRNDLESPQEDVLDLSLGNVSLHSVPQILNKYGSNSTVNENEDNTTIFDDNNSFVKNHIYKLLPITFEEIDQELIHMEHDYCSISSGSDKEAEFSRGLDSSLVKNRVYKKKREKSSKSGNKNTGFDNNLENNTSRFSSDKLDIMNTELEMESQLVELDFSSINLRASILMHHAEVDYRELLQPLDLTSNIAEEKKTEDIQEKNQSEDKDDTCNPELNVSETDINAEDSDNIVVGIMRPNCGNYKPCKTFLSEIAYLVPYLVKDDHKKINILDLCSENVNNSNERKTFFFISEDHWKSFQNSSERIILTNDKSIGNPVSTKEKDDGTPTYLLFDKNSLRNSLAKHCQDIGAILIYRVLKDFSEESNITSENAETDNGDNENLFSYTVEDENEILDNEVAVVDDNIESIERIGGVINSGLLKKLLSKCITSRSRNAIEASGRIKCNECLEKMNPCTKCLDSMNKTYFNRASQISDKKFRNLSSKKHWSRMVRIENIFNSNPIVQEMKSKEGSKKKDLKGKSAKKKKIPNCTKNRNFEETLKKKDLEPPRIGKPNGIINSGILKALLTNSNDEPNTAVENSLHNEITEYLVDQSDVDNSNQIGTNMCSDQSWHDGSIFIDYSRSSGNTSEACPEKWDELSNGGIDRPDSNPVLDLVMRKEEPSLNNEYAQEIKINGKKKKKSVQSSTLKKPRRSLDISIEEIANLGLGVEKRTRSGREVPKVLSEKTKKKRSSKKDSVNIKKESTDKNLTIMKDVGGDREKLVGGNASGTQNILKSLLLDAARKITEPSEAPILCDILPTMGNLNIPIAESNMDLNKNEKKMKKQKSVKGEKKNCNRKSQNLESTKTVEANDITPSTVNVEEPDNKLEISGSDKTEKINVEDNLEQKVLFFECNLNLDETNKSEIDFRMCTQLENNIAEDLGMLSNGFDDYDDGPEKVSLKLNGCNDLGSNEINDFDENLQTQSSITEADVANENPSPTLSSINVEEKNNDVNKVMLRFKNTISEKMKAAVNNIDESCNSVTKKDRGRPKRDLLENADFDLKTADDNNQVSSCTEVENSGIFHNDNDLLKHKLGDIEADFQEINIQIKKEANERRKIELNGNNSKDINDYSKKLGNGLMTESLAKGANDSTPEPFRNRLRNKNKNDSTDAKIAVKDGNNGRSRKSSTLEEGAQDSQKKLKNRNGDSDASKSCKKRKKSKGSVENSLRNSLNDSVETSQPSKKVRCELLGKFINPPLEKTDEKSFGDPTLDLSLTYERTTRSGKMIQGSTVPESVKIDPAPKKKNHQLTLLNIEEPKPENLRKTEINLRRRTVDRSSLLENGEKKIAESATNNLVPNKRESHERSFESKKEINKKRKVSNIRHSLRLRNK